MKQKFNPDDLKALGFKLKTNNESHKGMPVIIDEYTFEINKDVDLYISHTFHRMPDKCELIAQSNFAEIVTQEGMIPITTIDSIEKIQTLIHCLLGIEPQTINSLCTEAHNISKKSGFWDDVDEVTKIVYQASSDFKAVRAMQLCDFINAIDTNSKLMLITGEVAEASEALRKGFRRSNDERFTEMYGHFQHIVGNSEAFIEAYNLNVKGTFDEELADIVIRVFDLAGRYGVNLQRHINQKMTYNSHRPKKHGKTI